MRETKASFRIYSEKEHPLGPPPDQRYTMDAEGRPILLPRDTRVWASQEYLERILALRAAPEVEQED